MSARLNVPTVSGLAISISCTSQILLEDDKEATKISELSFATLDVLTIASNSADAISSLQLDKKSSMLVGIRDNKPTVIFNFSV